MYLPHVIVNPMSPLADVRAVWTGVPETKLIKEKISICSIFKNKF